MAGQLAGRQARRLKCPHCGHEEFRLSHRRNLWERAVSTAGIRPVRCLGCNERRLAFVGFGPFSPPGTSRPVRKLS